MAAGRWRERPGARTVRGGLVRPVPVAAANRLSGGLGRGPSSLRFFGRALRQRRAGAKLTEEELAAAAGLSPRSVSNLERGTDRTAHKDTAALLAGRWA